jgi:hypothetical protein
MSESDTGTEPVKTGRYESPEKAAPDFITGLIIFAISIYVMVEAYHMPHFAGSGWLGSPGPTARREKMRRSSAPNGPRLAEVWLAG